MMTCFQRKGFNQVYFIMKVLIVSPLTGIVGGISVWTKNILSYLTKQDNVQVEVFDFSRTRAGQMIKGGFRRLFLAAFDYFRLTRRAGRVVREFDGDVVHICSSASFLLIRDYIILRHIKRKHHVRSCVHFHFGRIPELAQKRNWEWKLLKKVVRDADEVTVMDRYSLNALKENDIRNVSLLPNPLSESVCATIDSVRVERERRRILFAGHCIPTKGVYELVEACRKIPDIKLRMVGAVSQEMKHKLLSLAGNDSEWLEIQGQLSHNETVSEMKLCDIFVLPTYTEGFPNVIIESMACACPIIASAVGAIPEMLEEEDGKSYGQLIQPKDPEQIRVAIERYLSDQEYKRECGENARRRVRERYNVESIGVQLTKIWERVIAEK